MRRQLGTLLTVFGATLLVFVGVTYARGALARERLRAEWDAREARAALVAAEQSIEQVSDGPPSPGAPVGRLLIPRIRLDEIIVEGVDDDALNAGPGHLPGSVLPGATGNAVISAHRDRHFRHLDAVAVGDTIHTMTMTGRSSWIVTARRVVSSHAPALFTTREATLTLTTCWPVRMIGPAPDRLILTAKPIRTNPRA